MKSVYAETLYIYNLNVSSEQAEFLCNPNVKLYKIVIKNLPHKVSLADFGYPV